MIKIAELSTYPEYFRWKFPKGTLVADKWIRDHEYIHDSDNCGCKTTYWVVVIDGSAKFYKCSHSWEWENFGTDESDLVNEFDITEVTKESLPNDKYVQKNLGFVV